MPTNMITKYGEVTIEPSVIAKIAGISAMESYGIVGMASQNATDGIFELLKWDNLAKGIKVTMSEEVNIDLHVILEYGVRISVVAENIIDRVKFNVENMTGIKIDNVNVHVEGIRVGNN